MLLKFVKLHGQATLPKAVGDSAMAVDLYACRDSVITASKLTMIDTGVVFQPGQNIAGAQLSLRSGFATKGLVSMLNGVGVIERSFTGFEVNGEAYGISCGVSTLGEDVAVKAGDRVAQLMIYSESGCICPGYCIETLWSDLNDFDTALNYRTWYERLGPSANGRGGFGSTGS